MMHGKEKTRTTSQDLTKLILNNTIVELRKNVQQARVHTINKLCREIKKLRSMTGTEEQKIKNSNKADRFVQQIMFMKKVQKDDVTKFALRNEKSLIEITNDVHETLETKALARLANHKGLVGKIKAFRTAYPRWKDSLDYLLSTLGEKHKDKKGKKTSSSCDSTKLNKTSGEKNCNVNKKMKIPQQNSDRYFTNSSGRWSVADTKDQSCREVNLFEDRESKIKINAYENTEPTDQLDQKNYQSKDEKLKKINSFENEEVTDRRVNEIKIKDEPVGSKNRIKNEELKNEDRNVSEDQSITKAAADPFFITKDNKSYMSISIKDVVNDTDDFQDNNFYEKRRNLSFKNSMNTDRKPDLDFSKSGRKFDSKEKNNKFKGSNLRVSKNYEHKPDISASLHPSWEAKKRQSIGIQNCRFQGKKIKFDE